MPSVPEWSQRDGWIAAAMAILSLVSSAVTLIYMPFDVADEGYHYYIADRLVRGDALFRDIRVDSYLPGAFAPFSLAFWLLEPSVTVGRGVIALGLALSAVAGYVTARQLMARPWAILATAALTLLPGPIFKFYLRGLTLPMLACAAHRLRQSSDGSLLILAAWTGVAWITRMDALYVGLALFAGLALVERRSVRRWPLALVIGLLITPMAVVTVTLSFTGGAAEFLYKTIGVLRIARWRVGSELNVDPPHASEILAMGPEAIDAWVYYGSLVLVFALFVRALWALRFGLDAAAFPGLVLGWTVMHVPQFLLARPDTYHIMQQYFAFAIAGTWLASQAWPDGWPRVGRTLPHRSFSAAAALVLLLWVTAIPVGRFSVGGRWSMGVWLRRAHRVVAVTPNGTIYPTDPRELLPQQLSLIEAVVGKDQSIVVVPFQPGLAFLAQRRLATSDPYSLPIVTQAPGRLSTMVEEIASGDAPLAFYGLHVSANGEVSGRVEKYAPSLHRVITSHYQPLWTGPIHTVYVRTEPTLARPSAEPPALSATIDGALNARQFELARQLLAIGFAHNGGSPWLLSQLGRLGFVTGDEPVFLAATERAVKALESVKDGGRLSALYARNVFRLAMHERRAGRANRALALFELAVLNEPTWLMARFELARALLFHGFEEAAVQQLNWVLQRAPDFEGAVSLRNKLSVE